MTSDLWLLATVTFLLAGLVKGDRVVVKNGVLLND